MRPSVLVAIGGAAGATVRWGVGELVAAEPGRFPLATFLVNVAGCLAIGLCARRLRSPELWLLTVTGGLGGLTTCSTFAVETRGLLDGGHAGTAAAYVVATMVVGVGATQLARGPARGTEPDTDPDGGLPA